MTEEQQDRNRHDDTIREPESSTVDDWFGQNVARDQEIADRVSDEHPDPHEAEEAFDRRAVGRERYEAGHPRPGDDGERGRGSWDDRLGGSPGRSITEVLGGSILGYPVHPMFTDMPIGFWTSSWVLDLLGGERAETAADRLIGIGVLSAVPTAVTGWATRGSLDPERRRLAGIHGLTMAAATSLYGVSWLLRRRGSRGAGVAVAQLGAVCATLGAHVGGRIAFGDAADHHDAAPDAAGPPTGPASLH